MHARGMRAGRAAAAHADRLKVTLATSYFLSRLAWSCLAHQELYEALQYEGESMMHWCKREVEWAAEWLLKTHVASGGDGGGWQAGDRLVLMVRSAQRARLAQCMVGC